jgi:hypothetical protein
MAKSEVFAQDIEHRSLTNFGSILAGIEPDGASPTSRAAWEQEPRGR